MRFQRVTAIQYEMLPINKNVKFFLNHSDGSSFDEMILSFFSKCRIEHDTSFPIKITVIKLFLYFKSGSVNDDTSIKYIHNINFI